MKKEKESVEFENLFTPEELETLNLSQDELELLHGSYILSETSKILPDKTDELINRVQKTFEGLSDEEIKTKTTELAKSDPEFIKQIVTLYSLYTLADEEEDQPGEVQKVTLSEINQVKEETTKLNNKAMMDSIIATIKSVD